MAKVKVRLTHQCNAPEHPGISGDVVSVDEELAKSWATKGGCQLLAEEAPAPKEDKPAAKKDK